MAPTSQSFDLMASPVTGVVAPPGSNNSSLFSQVANSTTATYSITDGINLSNATHYRRYRMVVVNSTASYMKIQIKSNNASTTITPATGSRWRCKRFSASNVGNYVA